MLLTEEIKQSIENLVGFLNVSSIYFYESDYGNVAVGLDIKNMGVGGLLPTKKRLQTELEIVIGDVIYDYVNYHVNVEVEIGCC